MPASLRFAPKGAVRSPDVLADAVVRQAGAAKGRLYLLPYESTDENRDEIEDEHDAAQDQRRDPVSTRGHNRGEGKDQKERVCSFRPQPARRRNTRRRQGDQHEREFEREPKDNENERDEAEVLAGKRQDFNTKVTLEPAKELDCQRKDEIAGEGSQEEQNQRRDHPERAVTIGLGPERGRDEGPHLVDGDRQRKEESNND